MWVKTKIVQKKYKNIEIKPIFKGIVKGQGGADTP